MNHVSEIIGAKYKKQYFFFILSPHQLPDLRESGKIDFPSLVQEHINVLEISLHLLIQLKKRVLELQGPW